MLILLVWDLSTLCVVDHLWPLIYIYIYIYIDTHIFTYSHQKASRIWDVVSVISCSKHFRFQYISFPKKKKLCCIKSLSVSSTQNIVYPLNTVSHDTRWGLLCLWCHNSKNESQIRKECSSLSSFSLISGRFSDEKFISHFSSLLWKNQYMGKLALI